MMFIMFKMSTWMIVKNDTPTRICVMPIVEMNKLGVLGCLCAC